MDNRVKITAYGIKNPGPIGNMEIEPVLRSFRFW